MFAVCMQSNDAHHTAARASAAVGRDRGLVEDMVARCHLAIENAPLGALEGSELESAFHAWIGRSRRRYIFTIAPAQDINHETRRGAVVVCAARGRNGRCRALFVGEPHEVPDALWQAGPAIELHYHLLATTPQARRAMIDDLASGRCL